MPKKQPPSDAPSNSGKDSRKQDSNARLYLKYSGMAFEMAAILFVAVLIGKKIDAYMGTERPWFTLLFVILGAFAAFYYTLKDLFLNKDR